MTCRNCAKKTIYAERPIENAQIYGHKVVSSGGHEVISYAAKHRKIVCVYCGDSRAFVRYSPDELIIDGPAGVEVLVRFVIGT